MKRLFLILTLTLSACIWADGYYSSGYANGITWRYCYYVSGHTASIRAESKSAISTSTTGSITIPSTLGGYRVTSIGWSAFDGCSGLTGVTIPDSVTSIGSFAFSGCSGFTSVTIPDSVTSIDSFAFSGCSGLTSVTIPDSVTSIGFGGAFPDCSGLLSFVVGESNLAYKSVNGLLLTKDSKKLVAGINGNVTIPDSVTSIEYQAFRGCSGLTNVTIPDSVTYIGSDAFEGCSGLTSVTIPDSVTSIQSGVFYDCSGLTSVTIPDSVTSIGRYAFKGCSGLTSVTIPDSVTDIETRAFKDCSGLTRVTFHGDVNSIADDSFTNCCAIKTIRLRQNLSVPNGLPEDISICRYTLDNISEQKVLRAYPLAESAFENFGEIDDNAFDVAVINEGESEIPKRAFYACTRMKEVEIPDSVAFIDDSAFEGCSGLESLTIPEGITRIGDSAFEGCAGLETVTIPESVTVIGGAAFRNCSSLKTVYMSGSLINTFDESVFEGCDSDIKVFYSYVEEPGKTAKPPMEKDDNVSITPTTRNFGVNGGGNAIVTSGSGTWTAAVSDPWITLNATSGNVGYPVAYTVSANTNVEQRTGYVYVSGWVHTVTQDGVGATTSPENATFEHQGGSGTIGVTAPSRIVWQARSNVDWLSVSPASGAGEGSVTYLVEPYDEVATRQGTLTVAGNTFTVFQYGRRMSLAVCSATRDYYSHVIPITVNALAITQWSVEPNNSWISIVDAGNGKGGDLVTVAIAENPSYKARTGTVTIGTETFTVTQQGRPTDALSFIVSPTASTASVEGANGMIAVTATPDLPWTATSGANWLTVFAGTANGAGNGNVFYSASPNPTLYDRTGHITVTPETASGMAAKTHTVTQPAAVSALSMSGYEFEASGESCSVDVSVANIVEWSVVESLDWLSVNGSTSRVGPDTLVLQASENNTVYPRSGTVTIAGKTFTVTQKARGVEVEYDTKLFGTDGGSSSISIHPDGNSSWTAVASDDTWITIYQNASGTGDGEILYIVSPYVGDGTARTGWITVGDKRIYITQRQYDLNIDPIGEIVKGNNGAGEFGVSATIGDVWTAIVTEPWITLVSGYDSGTGSGTVRFIYTENTTGKQRVGKIIVNGEVYTLTQRARTMVAITATAEHGGSVSGGGSYDLGDEVTLTAIPDSGYKFSYWTGDVESLENPLTLTADVAKSVTAVFEPLPIVFESVVSSESGVTLKWNNLAWATKYHLYRGVTSVPSSATEVATIANDGNCEYFDDTGDVDVEYWYWIEAEGAVDDVMSDPMTGKKLKPIVYSTITYENLRGATNPNPDTYQEGKLLVFSNPGNIEGYTFAGWSPGQITTDMTGAQTVRASWTANVYSIVYNPGAGSGEMEATAATYDEEAQIALNGFTYYGHVFAGWAIEEGGNVVYAPGQAVTNLTAQSNGIITLYAVWVDLVVATPTISPADGTVFTGDSCEVTLSCATEGATIYYSTTGSAPRPIAANVYSGPFTITDTKTIIAIAVKEGVYSDTKNPLRATITKKTLTLADAACADATISPLSITTGGVAEWTPIVDPSSSSGYSAKSGAMDAAPSGLTVESWLEAKVVGAGSLTFKWKVDCEADYSGLASWHHVAVLTNGVEIARIDGSTGWLGGEELSFIGSAATTNTIRWVYVKDEIDDVDYEDCAWVSGIVWTPTEVGDPAIPKATTEAEVTEAMADATDSLKENITSVGEYEAFRNWANGTGSSGAEIKASENGWVSFALDSSTLITKELTNDDILVEKFEPGETSGEYSLEVAIEDVTIGDNAASERLVKAFGLEGASELDMTKFSGENVTLQTGEPKNGKVKLTAKPKENTGTFFMRVRLNR